MEVVKEGVGEQLILAEELDAPAWLGEVDLGLFVGCTRARCGVRAGWERGGGVEVDDGLHGEVAMDLKVS